MKDIAYVEKLLQNQAAPKPRRRLSSNFTSTILQEIYDNPKSKRRPWWQHYLPFHKPAAALASAAALAIFTGTAYAATDGFTKLPSFLNIREATEQVLSSGEKIISINTQDCKIVAWDEAAKRLTATDRTFLYRLKPGSKMTGDQVAQMVQGKCEFEAQTATSVRQSALASYVAAHPTEKDHLVGGYASEIITAITPGSLSIHGEMQYDGSVKKYDLTFNSIAPDVTVAKTVAAVGSWRDLEVGDSITYVYQTTGNGLSHSETTPPWELNTHEVTIVYVEKNPPNVRAYFDFTNHIGVDFEEVVQCQSNQNGYCAKYITAPQRTEFDNTPAAMVTQDAYMYLMNSRSQYITENPQQAADLKRKFLASFTPGLRMTIESSPNYSAALCGHLGIMDYTPQHARKDGDNIVRTIDFRSTDYRGFSIEFTVDIKTNLVTSIDCRA